VDYRIEPVLYYPFKEGANIKIPLTNVQAATLRDHGQQWIADPQKTEKDFEDPKAAVAFPDSTST